MDFGKSPRGLSFIRIKKTSPFDLGKFVVKKDESKITQGQKTTISNTNISLGTGDIKDLVPKFKTLNKIEFDDAEIYAGLIRDPTSKNGLRYVIIEPQMSKNDDTNFRVIKKLLISELDITLNSIKTKKEAAQELKLKILNLIKKD